MAKTKSFEESIIRLQEIVGLMEQGETSLEQSLKLFEEGAALSQSCYSILKSAEQKVAEIAAGTGGKGEEDD